MLPHATKLPSANWTNESLASKLTFKGALPSSRLADRNGFICSLGNSGDGETVIVDSNPGVKVKAGETIGVSLGCVAVAVSVRDIVGVEEGTEVGKSNRSMRGEFRRAVMMTPDKPISATIIVMFNSREVFLLLGFAGAACFLGAASDFAFRVSPTLIVFPSPVTTTLPETSFPIFTFLSAGISESFEF